MAVLAPGRLLKFLLTGEYGWLLLQVIDILPVDLDLKELWPKQGFRIMLSDGRHSTYVSLSSEQEELVLSNELQVGQFIYVNKIVPAASVPYIQGLHPTPGWHPLVGTPEDLANLISEPNLAKGKSNNLKRSSNVSLPGRNEKSPTTTKLSHMRASFIPAASLKVRSSTCTLRKDVTVADGDALPKSLPGKLGTLGKEALRRRDAAFVAASIAHQEAAAMEALVKILKKFAELCSGANPKAPETAVEQFLDIHQRISKALTAMEKLIKTATSDKIQAFEGKEKLPYSSNTDRSFLREIGCSSTTPGSPLKLSKTWLRKSPQDLSGSSKAGLLSISSPYSQAHVPSKRTLSPSISCSSKRLPPRNSLSPGTDNSPIPKRNSNPNFSSSLQKPTRFCDQDNEKKYSNPTDQQLPHAKDSKRKNGFYQMANLVKQMKNEIESWFIEFIEKMLDTCLKNMKSFGDSRAKIVDSIRIPLSVSRKKVLLTTLIDWVESQFRARNREGLSSYPKLNKVLSRLKLKAKKR